MLIRCGAERARCGGHVNLMDVADEIYEVRRNRRALEIIGDVAKAQLSPRHALRCLVEELTESNSKMPTRHKIYSRRTMRGVRDFYNDVYATVIGEDYRCDERVAGNGDRIHRRHGVQMKLDSVFEDEINEKANEHLDDDSVELRLSFSPFTEGVTIEACMRGAARRPSEITHNNVCVPNVRKKKIIKSVIANIEFVARSNVTHLINYVCESGVEAWDVIYSVLGRALRLFSSMHVFPVGRSLYDVLVARDSIVPIASATSTVGNFTDFTNSTVILLRALYCSMTFGVNRRLPWDRIKYQGHRCVLPTKTTGVYAQMFLTGTSGHRMLCRADESLMKPCDVLDWWRVFQRCSRSVNARLNLSPCQRNFNEPFANFMYRLEACCEPSITRRHLIMDEEEVETDENEEVEDDVALADRISAGIEQFDDLG